MAPQTVSKDRKALIPHLYHTKRLKVRRICEYLRVKKTCVYTALKYYHRFGVPWNVRAKRSGRHRKLSYVHLNFIYHFLQENPCTYIDELQDIIRDRCGTHISFQTICRTLRYLHYSHKTVSKRALERNEKLRALFDIKIGELVRDPNMLVFLDEAARNDKTAGRNMGWSLRGTRCIQRRRFVRGKRYSILPALTLDGIIAHEIYEGSVTSERFYQFLKDYVVSFLLLE